MRQLPGYIVQGPRISPQRVARIKSTNLVKKYAVLWLSVADGTHEPERARCSMFDDETKQKKLYAKLLECQANGTEYQSRFVFHVTLSTMEVIAP